MPIVSMVVGKPDFSYLNCTINGTIFPYGKFIQAIIMFLLIAFALFLVVKAVNRANKKDAEAPAPAVPAEDIVLLREIRDALKKFGENRRIFHHFVSLTFVKSCYSNRTLFFVPLIQLK
jgi:large conductance mechanosensitive channel